MARLKKEFRQRLIKLNSSINRVLETDEQGYCKPGDLFPHLFQVFSYLWYSDKVFKTK